MKKLEKDETIDIAQKVAFLQNKINYDEVPDKLEVMETHMSWVFLTDNFVYKFKKPVKVDSIDFSTLPLRYINCKEELLLNRRLAKDIYLDLIPLTIEKDGSLKLNGSGEPKEWLIKMRRLSEDKMLDYAIINNTLSHNAVQQAAIRLAQFYQNSNPVETSGSNYRDRLRTKVLEILEELLLPMYGLPVKEVNYISTSLLRFLENFPSVFDKRVDAGKIIEGHGDLRPEHIHLGPPPVFFDCLEFDIQLRKIDPVEELSFLAIECEMLEAKYIGDIFLKEYQRISGDRIPEILIWFHKSKQLFLRAKYTIWHLKEECYQDDPSWAKKTSRYLQLARQYINQLNIMVDQKKYF